VKIVGHLFLHQSSIHELAGLVLRQSEPLVERKLRSGRRLGERLSAHREMLALTIDKPGHGAEGDHPPVRGRWCSPKCCGLWSWWFARFLTGWSRQDGPSIAITEAAH